MNGKKALLLVIFSLALGACGVAGKKASNTSPASSGIPECDKLFNKLDEKTADKSVDFNANSNSAKGLNYRFIRDDIVKPLRKEIAKPDANKKELAEQCKGAYEAFVPKDDQ